MKGIKIKNLASRIKSIYETDNPLLILAMRGVKVLELELDDDMEYFEGAYIGNKDVNMVVYNKNLKRDRKKLVLWHETGHNVAHRDINISSVTKNISLDSEREELEADIFAAEAIIDDDTFLDYLKFYRYTDSQIACDLNIPVKYVRLKFENFDKSKLL